MKKLRYALSASARLDILNIWNYLATHVSIDVADKVSGDIESAIIEVSIAPGHGHRRADVTKREILFFRIHSYLIVYRPKTVPLHVLRVLHAARDIKTLLDDT